MPTPYLGDREPAMIRTFANEFNSAEEWGESVVCVEITIVPLPSVDSRFFSVIWAR